MIKFARYLIVILLVLVLAPAVLADDDQPIYIKSAVVETEDTRVLGNITVCNTERERIRFVLDFKNLTINSIYKRKLTVNANDCLDIKVRFTKDFTEMTNVGDEILIRAKRVRGLWSYVKYDLSDKYTTNVVKGSRDDAGCGDQTVDDGTINACEMDFIYHEPSGLRIKVLESNTDYVQLKLIHIEWGGTKTMRIYKGRTKKIRSNHSQLERVEISNVQGDNARDLYLKIES